MSHQYGGRLYETAQWQAQQMWQWLSLGLARSGFGKAAGGRTAELLRFGWLLIAYSRKDEP